MAGKRFCNYWAMIVEKSSAPPSAPFTFLLTPELASNEANDYTKGGAYFWIDEAVMNGSIKKVEKRGNVGKPSKDRSRRDDNKRTRTENVFATIVNPVGREKAGTWPKCATCNSYHAPGGPCRTCFNCNHQGHLAKDCRGMPKNVNHVNAKNLHIKACYECGSTDHVRPACPRLNRAQGPEGNRPNQVAAKNKGIKPSDLGFRYENEIASRRLAEIDKVIKGCKLEIEGYVFDIDLILFGHGSFDVIIGVDWLSNYKAEIICHEKVVRIPLPDGNVLRVLGKRPKEKARFLMGVKKQEEIVVVRDFLEIMPPRMRTRSVGRLVGELRRGGTGERVGRDGRGRGPRGGNDDRVDKLNGQEKEQGELMGIMELYMMNRQHGRMILESVQNGPLIWPTIEENSVNRPRKYSELTPAEAIQADYDVKETNIILQGLPPEVYALVK
nr:hypothetical protein [Tanacetum cinerariifolium]